ncbi:flagellar basal-body rod protein FlgG [Alicyclobacillus contaminans]|uniref:flagellar hook-basal body complex protein n=1 Tax=Alicyclobacillus contaminans TaxID=392016 RepID=UPI0004224508|nr:flagellar hook-basal body complex protein [Alicyclobacillus contaminans]GMA49032.1 flagellar basal-body rod protein FlgG [Alicyclobacillus contaminans]
MLRSMYSAVSGMQAFQTKLDVIGNNIANVDTTGFKAGRVDFSDVLSQTMTAGSSPSTTSGGTNPQQVGLGVKVADIQTLFTQGADQSTGNPLDTAINGDGLFVVKDANGNLYYTREGDFTVDANGKLVLPNGMFVLDSSKAIINTSGYSDIQIGPDGSVTGIDTTTNKRQTIATLGLATFPNYGGLEKVGDSLYEQSNNSGSPTIGAPGQNNSGTLANGYLEMSNVDLTQEFTQMIIAQRGFDANSKMIGTDNAILQDVVNLKNS